MLEAIKLTKSYNGQTALDNLNLRIEAGEVFCLLGANGAGKTTTINLFLNFVALSIFGVAARIVFGFGIGFGSGGNLRRYELCG